MKSHLIISPVVNALLGVFLIGISMVNGFSPESKTNFLLGVVLGVFFLVRAFDRFSSLKKSQLLQDKAKAARQELLSKTEDIEKLEDQLVKKTADYEKQLLNISNANDVQQDDLWVKALPLGILRFDCSGKMIEELSSNCCQYFGEGFADKEMSELLYLDEDDQQYFKSWLGILDVNSMPMNHLADLLPTDVELPNPVKRKRGKTKPLHLRYTFSPIESTSARRKVEGVMVFILDVSKERIATQTLAVKEGRLEFILNILRDRDRYIKYLENCFDCIDKIEKICDGLLEGNPLEKVNSAFRLVHTVRGNSAAFGVQSLRDTGDVLERILLDGRDGAREVDAEYMADLKAEVPLLRDGLTAHLKQTETTFNEVFDPSRTGNRTFRVPSFYIEEFEAILSRVEDEDFRIKLIRKLKEIYMVPVRKLLLQYSDTVKQLAERQSKLLSPLVITGGETLVNEKQVQSFFNSFIHLVLNCIDHGIELPNERLEAGKIEEAIVRIRTQADDEGVYISIEDDGRGLDVDHIVKRALQKNMVTEVQLMSMTKDDKLNLIFKEGFSTTRKITSVSGRGMGMSAVMHEVKALKGTIKVSTVFGKGTLFTIFLPVEAF